MKSGIGSCGRSRGQPGSSSQRPGRKAGRGPVRGAELWGGNTVALPTSLAFLGSDSGSREGEWFA